MVKILSITFIILFQFQCLNFSNIITHCENICQSDWVYPLNNPKVINIANIPLQNWNSGHRGIDIISIDNSADIIAPNNGIILWKGTTGTLPTFTIMHTINNQNIKTTYQPATTDLTIGTRVNKSQNIGKLEEKEFHCQKCLHFGMVKDEKYLDPKLVIEGYKSIQLIS